MKIVIKWCNNCTVRKRTEKEKVREGVWDSGKTGDGFLSGLTEREKNHGKSNQSDTEL